MWLQFAAHVDIEGAAAEADTHIPCACLDDDSYDRKGNSYLLKATLL